MSESLSVVSFNQVADADKASPQHALAQLRNSDPKASSPDSQSNVTLTVHSVAGLLVLRARESKSSLSQAAEKLIGLALPDTLMSVENSPYCIRWISPDEWLVSCDLKDTYQLELSLREEVTGSLAVVDVSAGYCRFTLAGEYARQVLMKSTGYDVHEDHFPVNKVVNTTFAKAQVTLRALPDGAFELLVRRSFADYLFEWLNNAASEYGLDLNVED